MPTLSLGLQLAFGLFTLAAVRSHTDRKEGPNNIKLLWTASVAGRFPSCENGQPSNDFSHPELQVGWKSVCPLLRLSSIVAARLMCAITRPACCWRASSPLSLILSFRPPLRHWDWASIDRRVDQRSLCTDWTARRQKCLHLQAAVYWNWCCVEWVYPRWHNRQGKLQLLLGI
jgi:hypothetical protein